MKAHVEPLSPVKKKITVEIEAEDLLKEEETALARLRKQVTIPGFRKGKAPASVVKKRFGDSVRGDVISEMINKTYSQALMEQQIFPVTEADIEIEKADEDGSIVYSATVEVRPEIEPAGYEGMKLKRKAVEVTEEAIDERLEGLRKQSASLDPAPEGHEAAAGDMVAIDFVGKIDGVPFEGGSGENIPLTLGEGRMIPGFEDSIYGAKEGDEVVSEVTFPEEYHAKDLAGKAATFEIKVGEIKVRALPELDDDFAKMVAQLETLEELKADIARGLEGEEREKSKREFRGKLIEMLLEANDFEVPESVVTRQKEHSISRMTQDLTMRGMDPEAMGLDKPEFEAEARAAAERTVKWIYLRDAIAEAEGVTVDDEDVKARIIEIARADGRPLEQIMKFFESPETQQSLRDAIYEERTIELITAKADIEEVNAQEWAKWRGEDE
ncbi:MAG: trigger factor [Deltaproteobacteria bacterium]|nr:MAG: trigger factor [Deltaproteobacteria bacterium]